MSTQPDERAVFESWAKEEGYPISRERYDDEVYFDERTHAGWWAWQAARVSALTVEAAPLLTMGEWAGVHNSLLMWHGGPDYEPECPECTACQKVEAFLANIEKRGEKP